MLFALTRFLRRPPAPAETDLAFIAQLHVEHPREPRSRRSELVLGLGWALVVAKCVLVWWACRAYSVPIHPAWVIVPTLLGAVLCTALYWRRF
jgi:hypothetical protein